jgi:hypothetical protein
VPLSGSNNYHSLFDTLLILFSESINARLGLFGWAKSLENISWYKSSWRHWSGKSKFWLWNTPPFECRSPRLNTMPCCPRPVHYYAGSRILFIFIALHPYNAIHPFSFMSLFHFSQHSIWELLVNRVGILSITDAGDLILSLPLNIHSILSSLFCSEGLIGIWVVLY